MQHLDCRHTVLLTQQNDRHYDSSSQRSREGNIHDNPNFNKRNDGHQHQKRKRWKPTRETRAITAPLLFFLRVCLLVLLAHDLRDRSINPLIDFETKNHVVVRRCNFSDRRAWIFFKIWIVSIHMFNLTLSKWRESFSENEHTAQLTEQASRTTIVI